jgi:hypothetical protein
VKSGGQNKYQRYQNEEIAVYYLRVPDSLKTSYLPVGDVFCAFARMDFDASWNKIEGGSNRFWTAYAAAPNLSSADGGGYITFGQRPRFSKERYMEAMKHGVANVALSAQCLGIKHLIWMPFGMGAFLRSLPERNKSMNPTKMKELRMEIAKCQVDTLLPLLGSGCVLHLCINPGADSEEAKLNAIAFLVALRRASLSPNTTARVVIEVNADASQVACELSTTVEAGTSVMMLNAANQNLLGNHWWKHNSATVAIEENLHRRSVELACIAKAYNPPSAQSTQTLLEAVKLGRKVHHHLAELPSSHNMPRIGGRTNG